MRDASGGCLIALVLGGSGHRGPRHPCLSTANGKRHHAPPLESSSSLFALRSLAFHSSTLTRQSVTIWSSRSLIRPATSHVCSAGLGVATRGTRSCPLGAPAPHGSRAAGRHR